MKLLLSTKRTYSVRNIDLAKQLILACLLLISLGTMARVSRAADPAWWQSRGAVSANTTSAPNAVVNQGQLKLITSKAVQELNADLATSGGAGAVLNSLVAGWQQDYTTNGYSTNTSNPTYPYKPADFEAITVGQLKYIGNLVYSQLQAVGYSPSLPPWLVVNPNTDNALAVSGQLKTVFNFDLMLDDDNNGLPNWWENKYNVHPSDVNAEAANSGLSYLQKYQLGLNPLVASTAGDAFTDGWKVNHNLDPHHKMFTDNGGDILKLAVFTPLHQ